MTYKRAGGPSTPVFLTGLETGAFSGSIAAGSLTVKSPIATVGAHIRNASLSSAVTLTPQTGANTLIISAETQPVRITMDGTTATTTVGFRLDDGDMVVFEFVDGTTFSVIETVASAVIQYQWGTV